LNPQEKPESKSYDKILKENIASLFLPLTEKYLGFKVVKSEELKDKIQTTLEKEPDFIRIVETDTQKRFILHLEFQVKNETDMVYRMQEYYGILMKKYKLPIRPFVIYLGIETANMPTKLPPEKVFTGFELKDIKNYDYEELLASDIPEEIILAILCDFKAEDPINILKKIIQKLQELKQDEITLRKYIRQLFVLSRLRNLTQETQKQIINMGVLYDIAQDYLYQQGIEKGIEKGVEKGVEKEKKITIIKMLKDKSLPIEKIADLMDVNIDYILQIQQEIAKE
jgi:predicted transposase YdaD